jgi:K+-sensing histidine kinase KdpD
MTTDQTNIVVNKDRILLVDDDEAFLQVANSILKIKGYEIDSASTAKEALKKFEVSYYNLVLLDLLLPDMSGIELLNCINRVQPDVISIILTGYSSVENSVQSLNLGAFAYLEKPVKPGRLIDVIKRGLEKQRLLSENRRLLKELEQRNSDLNILLSVSQTVSSSLDPQNIVDSALEKIAQSLGIRGSYYLIYNHYPLTVSGFHGFDQKTRQKLKGLDINNPFFQSVCDKNEAEALMQIVDNQDPFLQIVSGAGFQSLITAPIALAREAKGVLTLVSETEHAFTPLEVNLLTAIGREIANAITNSRLLEEASNVRALRELDTLRTELLANVSHELRTPLAAIKGFASSLLQKDIQFDDETRQSFIQTIDSESDRLSHMIEDLLLMSKIEAGVYKARKEIYDMAEIIGPIRDRLFNITLKHHLRIDIPDHLPQILVDGPRIGEVISNLVENAVKYSPDGSDIEIGYEMQENKLVTHVKDQGAGIPKEYQSMVFDRFNQLASKNGQRKGSGLGLCICRGIIESHGGRIWVDSETGKGTRFSFTLPLSQPL